MAKDLKTRQQNWRDKQRAKGRKCYSVWLEPEVAQILDSQLPETGKQKAITRILSELLVTSQQLQVTL